MDNLHKPTSCAALPYFRVPSLALRAIHLVPRLRRVADLCSSTVSEMRICGYNAEEKILCRTPFPAYAVYHLHPSPRRKGRSSKRKGNHGCPFLFAPAASAAVPAPDGAMSPSWFTAKSPPGNGEPPARFGHTAKPVPATASLSSKTPFAFPTRRAIIDT